MWPGQELFPGTPRCPAAFLAWRDERSHGGSATSATCTVPVPRAVGCSPFGQGRSSPGPEAPRADPSRSCPSPRCWEQQAATPTPPLAHQPRNTREMPHQAPGTQQDLGKSLGSLHLHGEHPHLPSSIPTLPRAPALPAGEHMPRARSHQGLELPVGVPSPKGGTGPSALRPRAGGCLPAAPRHGLRPGRHRAAGAARVGLTPGFESVQEAAYQRSCCLCRFLSLLLPHPACRPHTYRPHRRSSAPPGCLQPQPRSPPANPRRVPVGAVFPPKKNSWGAPRGVPARARGARGALCARPWPGPAVGTRRDGWEPGHGDGAAGGVLSVASRGMVALPRATPWGPRTGPPPVPHCLHPLTRCRSQPGRSASHPPCPAVGDVARIPPGVPPSHPCSWDHPNRGQGTGAERSREGRAQVGQLCLPSGRCTSFLRCPQALAASPQPCHSSCLSWPRLRAQALLGPFPSSSAPTPLQRPRCSPQIAPGTVAQMPSPLAWPAAQPALKTRPPRAL